VGPSGDENFVPDGQDGLSPDPTGGLVLDTNTVQFHMLWVANSAENTVTKLDTDTGKEVARYAICGNPSRTAVDLNGDCWAACRADGKVAKITLDPAECVDKNGNGVVETSVDSNGDGKITGSELLPAGADECVRFMVQPDTSDTWMRAVAIDKDNFAWVGYYFSQKVYRLDPTTGATVATVNLTPFTNARPYGFAIDKEQRLWMSLRDGTPPALGMIDLKSFPLTPQVWGTPGSHNTYGIAIDSNGFVWLAGGENRNVSRFNPTTKTFNTVNLLDYPYTRGIAASTDGKVYVAHHTWSGACSSSHYVSVFDSATGQLADIINYAGNNPNKGPVGLSFDFDGNLWAINQCDSSASKIDAATGQLIGTYPVGANPYTYSDMTGFALKTVVAPEGTYTHTFKGWEGAVTQWYQINAGVTTPPGTAFEVSWRTADSVAALAGAPWSAKVGPFPPATMPIDLTDYGAIVGKYLQVEVTLEGSDDGTTPILKSLDIVAAIQQ
jgi:streptogramin lyase